MLLYFPYSVVGVTLLCWPATHFYAVLSRPFPFTMTIVTHHHAPFELACTVMEGPHYTPYLMDMPATDFLFIFLWAPLSPPYYSVVLHVCRRTVVYLLIMNLTHSLSFSPFSWADLMGHHRLYGNRLIGIWCSYSHWRLGPSHLDTFHLQFVIHLYGTFHFLLELS